MQTHGGAGVSSLLEMLPAGEDTEGCWPGPPPRTRRGVSTGSTDHVLLVARTNDRGLSSAQAAIQEWSGAQAPIDVRLAGLVLMADAPGRLPRALRARARLLGGAVTPVWMVPWCPHWRHGELHPFPPVVADIDRHLRQLTAVEQVQQSDDSTEATASVSITKGA